ncbi:hypothetical protein Vqi01_41470 [Micromonospora qiuiae]|uniref:Uncharacterized protein n=1 Tax=Micromonospora qiuiae TaxID=502268 RepID=A0ABQ4JFR4_9ACTN|nr:hypothetical protein Vqi01_41470 [Micromonospora qiuiae]
MDARLQGVMVVVIWQVDKGLMVGCGASQPRSTDAFVLNRSQWFRYSEIFGARRDRRLRGGHGPTAPPIYPPKTPADD